MFRMTVDPEDAPDKATFLRIGDLVTQWILEIDPTASDDDIMDTH